MNFDIAKREFLAASLGVSASIGFGIRVARAQAAAGADRPTEKKKEIPTRRAKTTRLFLSPPGWPNCIAVQPEKGLWVQEQRHDGKQEAAWLLEFDSGKLLHTVKTNSQDTSGMTWGDGYIWSGANGGAVTNHPNPPINGIFQTDMNSRMITRRQIPFGPAYNGGACHGVAWENGKIWVSSNRLGSLVRLDPNTWQVDWAFPHTDLPDLKDRIHGIEYDPATPGFLWQVSGTQSDSAKGPDGYTPKLVKYDITNGEVVEIVVFEPGSCDPHDIAIHNGIFYGTDAGEHPGWSFDNPAYQRNGWPPLNSPNGGYIFRIDFV